MSVKVKDAERRPPADGEKMSVKAQLAPGARVAAQLVVNEKSGALTPLRDAPARPRGLAPEFVSVTVRGELEAPRF